MTNQNTPWYVRYHIIPDPKKPRTPIMSIIHGYIFILYIIYLLIAASIGILLLISGQFIVALIFFGATYFLFDRIKKERIRDIQRKQQK